MSESDPATAIPHTPRPPKRKAPDTAIAAQSAALSALMENPTREIILPDSNAGPRRPLIPEISNSVQGSSAGAGSGEFHVYKASRRREYERLKAMDDEVAHDEAQREFERQKAEREARDDEKTARNRAKRARKNNGKGKKKGNTDDGVGGKITEVQPRMGGVMDVGEEMEDGGGGEGDVVVQSSGLVIHDDD